MAALMKWRLKLKMTSCVAYVLKIMAAESSRGSSAGWRTDLWPLAQWLAGSSVASAMPSQLAGSWQLCQLVAGLWPCNDSMASAALSAVGGVGNLWLA